LKVIGSQSSASTSQQSAQESSKLLCFYLMCMKLALGVGSNTNTTIITPSIHSTECLTHAASIAVTLAHSGRLVHTSSDGSISGQFDAVLGAYGGALKPVKLSTGKKKVDKSTTSNNVTRENVLRAVGIVEGKIQVVHMSLDCKVLCFECFMYVCLGAPPDPGQHPEHHSSTAG
jgi:hypothetical protein